jgi:molybdate-binding protein
MDIHRQHLQNARNQKLWRTLALKDAKYNLQKYHEHQRKGNYVLARGYKREAGFDLYWANRRGQIARREAGR